MATVYPLSHGRHASSQEHFGDFNTVAFADLIQHLIEVEVFQIILSMNILLIKLQELSDALE